MTTAKKSKPSSLGSFDTLRGLVAQAAQSPGQNPAPANAESVPTPAPDLAISGTPAAPGAVGEVNGYMVYDPDYDYKPGDHVLIPLQLLEDNPRNPRVFLVEKKTQELVASIAANGQMECGLAYPRAKNGKFRLKGGHRRRWSLEILNSDYMKIEIVAQNMNVLEEYRQARALNQDHQSHTHIDDALRFAELLAEGIAADQATLATALKVNKTDMSKSLSIAEMPRLLLEPMAEHIESFGLSNAYAIYRFWHQTDQDENRTFALIQKVIAGKLSVRALDALVKESVGSKDKSPVRREHAVARAVFSGVGRGELKSYAAGKLTLELSNLDPECRDTVYTRLVDVFKELGIIEDSGVPT